MTNECNQTRLAAITAILNQDWSAARQLLDELATTFSDDIDQPLGCQGVAMPSHVFDRYELVRSVSKFNREQAAKKAATKEAARHDVQSGQWNPSQFSREADKLSYANAWEYFKRQTIRTDWVK